VKIWSELRGDVQQPFGADAWVAPRHRTYCLDAQNQLRITAGMIWGLKKTRFNNQDFATVVCSSWAQP